MAERVLIYSKSFRFGVGKALLQYSNVLAEGGFKVTILASRTEPHFESALHPSINLNLLNIDRSISAIPGLTAAVRQIRPDLVLALGVGSMLPLTLAMKFARHQCPMILREANSPAGLLGSYGALVKTAKTYAMRDAYRRADRIICLTEAMRKELIADWNTPAEKLTHIPNGVPLPADAQAARPPSDTPVILCVARLKPQKDIPTLLRAFALLRVRRNCVLQLAGDGTDRPALEALAAKLGIAQDVTFLGHVSDPAPLYRAAHVTVLSSVFEGFPNTLIEALAQGCPVVATDCPTGPAEVIDSDAVGYLAKMRDPVDLAARLEQALDRDFDPTALRARAEFSSDERLKKRITAFFRSLPTAQDGTRP
ncbi:glycosyltransferase [Rhodobacteraceae bacterium 2376]|uniref:Glycosyltransferase n=1 Tax=Rhabdonatronobacter sediminivivens TaxID=2743469 RepID=A0A7Z0I260_9RHOB|nr:glycosyltransferase [Rhabdonatronobacter sediminivivens]NYS26561.1 glycosyltransferase [Rhabdonatronobacter sediminivivens]